MSSEVTPDYLREKRAEPSVLKAMLSNFRERHPCRLVLVLEGPDDLPVYEVWLSRLLPGLVWEPLVAHGKRKSLEFFDVISRDRTGVGICTYFVIDHDYDGMRGRNESNRVYVLPAYSIENLLVADEVLESILRTDLKIFADPDTRGLVVERYRSLRAQFADSIREPCVRLFGARNEKVGSVDLREGVMGCFDMSVDSVRLVDEARLKDLVRTERPVSAEGISAGEDFMSSRDMAIWIRGKYLLAFYKAFVRMISADRRSESPILFPDKYGGAIESPASGDLAVLASRSPLPAGLKDAVERWIGDCERECGERLVA